MSLMQKVTQRVGVPQRNVIGTMTTLVNRLSLWVWLHSIPASIPKHENVNPPTRIATKTRGSKLTSGDIRCPTTIMAVQLMSALAVPASVFPSTMDDMWMGQSFSSSKLM